MKKLINCLFCALSICGAIVGAGLVTGAEINSFFCRFNKSAFVGIFVCFVCFFVSIYYILCRSQKQPNLSKNVKYFNFLPFCQLFISANMVAGFCELLPKTNSLILRVAFIFVLVFVGALGIKFTKIINIIVPVTLIMFLPALFSDFSGASFSENISFLGGALSALFALSYVIMNLVASEPVIRACGKTKKQNLLISFLSSAIISGLVCLLFLLCINSSADMPLVALVGGNAQILYKLLCFVAILSTLFSASIGANKMFESYGLVGIFCTACGIVAISFIGLKTLVMVVYPLVGVVLAVQVVLNRLVVLGKIKIKIKAKNLSKKIK